MADTKTIKAIEQGNLVEAHGLIEKSLYQKAGAFLEEKKKQFVAKTWGKTSAAQHLTEDSKSIQNAAKRKAFREKMQKLRAVK